MPNKQPYPGCQNALARYYELRRRLHNYYFHNVELKITQSQVLMAYSDIFNLIDKNPQEKLNNEKKYQQYEETLFNVFKNDLTDFCQKVRQYLIQKKGTASPVDELSYYYEWIANYSWFLRWTYKVISSIQKNIAVFCSTSLYHTGLTIMRDQIINPLQSEIFRLIMANLQLFKQGALHQHTQLQFMIQVIGQCGFQKYFSIRLEKNKMGFFQFVSVNRETNLTAEVEYETDFFLRKFTNQYVKYLKNKYTKITDEMIKLSTPQYVNKASQHLQKQQKAANFFYPNPNVKNIIMRSIEETIFANKCKQLIENSKTGLISMVQADNAEALRNLYQLTKRTSMQKIFGQAYQNCIQKHINEEILMKLTAQQQKAAKRQTVANVVDSLYEYYLKIERITNQILDYHKDPNDLVLMTCQSNGFQIACNKSNTVCNFLAYYCDAMLKKESNTVDNSSKELIQKLSKLMKFLYSLDQFLKVYQRMLGIRILYDAFKSRQTQLQIISLLKKEVGLGSMAKVMTMIQDFKFSQNFNAEKAVLFRNKIPFNFHVNLITSGAWQIQDTKNNRKLVPPELMKAVEVFQEEYTKMFPGRQITWVFNYGRAIVQVKFEDQAKVLLLLNNYQLLTILFLQRRNFQSVKIQEIISEINPEQEPALMAALMMLVKKGVLKKQGNYTKIQSKNESISFNFELKLKVSKLGCFQVPRFAQRLPTINNQLNAQRAFIIQANIVKLMKMKRVLRYQDIIPQVISMCKTFKADVGMIKNQIQNCIHRQFLERDPKQFNMLIYKP